MRRWIATVTTTVAAMCIAPALVTAAQAQTAPSTTPEKALQSQFVPGCGVLVSVRERMSINGDTAYGVTTKGAIAFDKAGVAASDVKLRFDFGKGFDNDNSGLESPIRIINFRNEAFGTGKFYEDMLPAGRTWVRFTKGITPPGTGATVDILEPATLKGVLATATTHRPAGKVGDAATTTFYKGKISLADLYQISPSFRIRLGKAPHGSVAKMKIDWALWLGQDQLARRFVTTWKQSIKEITFTSVESSDTRFTAWGGKVEVKAPPATEWLDYEDLRTDVPDVPDGLITEILPGAARRS